MANEALPVPTNSAEGESVDPTASRFAASSTDDGEKLGFKTLPPASRLPREQMWQDFSRFGISSLDEFIARDQYPIPATVDREGYHGDRHFAFWCSGLWDYLTIRATLARNGIPLGRGDAVL